MKTIMSLFAILFSVQTWATSQLIDSDVLISEPQFVQLILKVYDLSFVKNPKGEKQFSNLLRCNSKRCYLLAKQWHKKTEPSFLKDVMYTPVLEDAVLDLNEYMQVQAAVTQNGNQVLRTKKIEVEAKGLLYSLTCIEIKKVSGGAAISAQCILYNGLR